MKTVDGIYTSAKVFTDNVEEYALAQIKQICDQPASKDSVIRVMPDVHPGKVGTIGLTMTIRDAVLPNVVGIDIGCGISITKLKVKKIEYQKLDRVIREHIPSGFAVRNKIHRIAEEFPFEMLRCFKNIHLQKAMLSMGTLGSGNHFLEIDKGEDGSLYAVVHSGSRNLGKQVTEYYLKQGQIRLKEQGIENPYELTYLTEDLLENYLWDLQVVQEFAQQNRRVMLMELEKHMKWKSGEVFSCGHNYVSQETISGEEFKILRKGAISAKENEKVIIPINMRDGIILGTGLGNKEWNYSAPHGAGRLLKREDVKKQYTISGYKKEMKGIYSSCIGKETLDEAPFAYRSLEEIAGQITDTVRMDEVIKPVYNFKAGDKER